MDNFCQELKPSHAYNKIMMSKDEWDTKEGPGKSNALYGVYTAAWQKAPFGLK